MRGHWDNEQPISPSLLRSALALAGGFLALTSAVILIAGVGNVIADWATGKNFSVLLLGWPLRAQAPSASLAKISPTGAAGLAALLSGDVPDKKGVAQAVQRQGFYAGEPLGAGDCSTCHDEIAAQWAQSAHRFASFNNPYYAASVEQFRRQRGAPASRFCAGCHDPLLLVDDTIAKTQLSRQTPAAQAGLPCLICHSIRDCQGTLGNGGYVLRADPVPPPQTEAERKQASLSAPPSAHAQRLRPALLGQPELCATCHKVGLTPEVTKKMGYHRELEASIESMKAMRRRGIRILPGPSSLWLDATGKRLPDPLYPGYDTLGTLEYICQTGYDYTWFVLDQSIIAKEFGLSGQEQNPDLTGKNLREVLARSRNGGPAPVRAFVDKGVDFVSANTLRDLVAAMNNVPDVVPLDYSTVEAEVTARDKEMTSKLTSDGQTVAYRAARSYLPDRLARIAGPHKLTDPKAGPMIAVKLHILTRKSLGGLHTDLDSRVLTPEGGVLDGLYAAGEAAGFGGGGVHGYRALEGTFLGGCIFSGRAAGRAAARAVG